MGKEDRASTQMSSVSNTAAHNEKVPQEVYHQLSKEFVPAVKDVAAKGAELLKNYHALQKSSDAYVTSLTALARTSKHGTSKKATEHGEELFEMLLEYTKILEFHKSCIKELASIVTKTTTYGNEDKDKLKTMVTKHQKMEKEIQSDIKHNKKKEKDLSAFYAESAEQFLKQQELRYKFFLEKHKRWFAKYADLMHQAMLDKEVAAPVEENGHVDSSVKKEEEKTIEEVKEDAPVALEPIVETVAPAEETAVEEETKQENIVTSNVTSARSSCSSMSPLPTRRPSNEIVPGVVLLNEYRRNSLVAKVEEKRAPVAAPRDTVERGSSPVPMPTPREERPQVTSPPTMPPMPQRPTPVANDYYEAAPRSKFEYKGPVIMPAPMPRVREPEIIRKETPVMVPRTVDAPVYARSDRPAYVPDRPHYHVESEYNPSVGPAHRPVYTAPKNDAVAVPSMFSASDYGRVLTVTQDFNATSGEQMTVNRDDKVILIKSGSRGWIFIQDQATQRTGWIPAPFVSY